MPRTRFKATLTEQYQAIAHEYMIEHGVEVLNMKDLADWAVRTGRFQRQPKSIEQLAREEISRALRAERHTDPQGRYVRTMHAAPIKIEGEQGTLWEWVDIRSAPPPRMRAAFSYKRQAILADVLRHKGDVDSYNDNNNFNTRLPLFDYDFNKDVAEAELPTEYNEDELDIELDDLDEDELEDQDGN